MVFRTKGQLAQVMIARAVAAGVPFGWVAGDTVYGNDRRLRRWLEEQGLSHVLAVKNNEPRWVDTAGGSAPVAARRLAQQIPEEAWQRLSAEDGSKGPRLYDWARVSIRPWSEPNHQALAAGACLVKGSGIADPAELAYYAGFSPANAPRAGTGARGGHSVDRDWSKIGMPSRRRSRRWAWTNTRCAAGLDGIDTAPPCRSTGQALALLVHAFLAVTKYYAAAGDAKGGR